jgi:hypothetical protein
VVPECQTAAVAGIPVEVHRKVWDEESCPVPVTAEQVVGQPLEAYQQNQEVLTVPDGVDPVTVEVLPVFDLQVAVAVPAVACPGTAEAAYAEAVVPVTALALVLVPVPVTAPALVLVPVPVAAPALVMAPVPVAAPALVMAPVPVAAPALVMVPVPMVAPAWDEVEQAGEVAYWESPPAAEVSSGEQQVRSGDRVQLRSYMVWRAWEMPVPYPAAFAGVFVPYRPEVFVFYLYLQASFSPAYPPWPPALPFSF